MRTVQEEYEFAVRLEKSGRHEEAMGCIKWLLSHDFRSKASSDGVHLPYVRAQLLNSLGFWTQKHSAGSNKQMLDAISYYLESLELYPSALAASNIFAIYTLIHDESLLSRYIECVGRYTTDITPHRDMILILLASLADSLHIQKAVSRCVELMHDRIVAALVEALLGVTPHLNASMEDTREQYDNILCVLEHYCENDALVEHCRQFFETHDRCGTVPPKFGFSLSYQPFPLLPAHALLARWYSLMFPFLLVGGGSDETRRRRSTTNETGETQRRCRIGFVSMNMRMHSVGKMFHKVICGLPTEKFHVSLFEFSNLGKEATITDPIARAVRERADDITVFMREDSFRDTICAWQKMLMLQNLDILVFPDLGAEPFTYYLSFGRYAPVQLTWWGHPESVATKMDYFVSSKLFSDTAHEYKERVIKMEGTGIYRITPQLPGFLPISEYREYWGIPINAHVYMCVQTLHKITPVFDDVVCGILRRDPEAIVVFMNTAPNNHTKTAFLRRLRARVHVGKLTMGDYMRVMFLTGHQVFSTFANICNIADVLLDTFPFGSSTSSMECFAIGKCVVTLNAPGIRGSMTKGLYAKMGDPELNQRLVAQTVEEYLDNAVHIARDAELRNHLEQVILEKSREFLFDDSAEMKAWENILLTLYKNVL